MEELAGIVDANRELAAAFALSKPSEATTIVRLTTLQHGTSRPAYVPDSWALTSDWTPVPEASDELSRDLARIAAAEQYVSEKAGVPWYTLPDGASLSTADSPSCARQPLDFKPLTAAMCEDVAGRFEQTAANLERQLSTLQAINRQFGLVDVVSFGDGEKTFALAELAHTSNKPLRGWLEPTGSMPRAPPSPLSILH